MRVSTYCVTRKLPLHVTRMPGYFGLARAAGVARGGASDLGATGFDAGPISPAAEVLIETGEDFFREGARVGLTGWLGEGGDEPKNGKAGKLMAGFNGGFKGKERRKRDRATAAVEPRKICL